MRCSKCGFDNPGGMKFCGQCTAPLALVCPKCGSENPPGFRFCGQCTTALGSGSAKPLVSNPISIPETDNPTAFVGERKTVTALFADIKGSMELMEDLDPEEARAIVDPALKLMIDAVRHYDGYVVQSTGDGIFALFGAPVAHEDHPQRALYVALRMHEAMRQYGERLRADNGLNLQLRIGVNIGEVVVRNIATGAEHTEYSPIGYSTSLAARLQTLATPGSTVISGQMRALVEGYFQIKGLGPTRIKGVTEPVELFEVTGLGPLRTRLQRAAGRGLTKFVGRGREIEALRHASELARSGRGQIVAALADPGVGKSRLFYEFKATSASGWMVLEALSISHGKASAYLPVIDLLRNYFEILATDDERKRREKVAGKVTVLDRALEDTMPYLFSLLGIVEGDDPTAQTDGQVKKRRTIEAIRRILLRESVNQPLMVVFEDLHWMDSESEALLNLLTDSIANSRILLLINYRPEYHHQWGSKTYYTQLRLDPLGTESSDEMLSTLLGSDESLVPLKQLIAEKAEGNPLFMEEIVLNLFEDGTLKRNGEVKLAKPLASLRIPPTVQSILASRIDRLPLDEKDLLQTVAVIGTEFTFGIARAVSGKSDDDLVRMLNDLQLAEFVYERPAASDVEYTFKHALTHDVAYSSLLGDRRKLLHERVGLAIESLYSGQLEDHLTELVHHFDRGGDVPKGVEYLRRTGTRAADQVAHSEAIGCFSRALELLPQLPDGATRNSQELDLQLALNWSLVMARGLQASSERESALVRARELCERLRDEGRMREVLLALAHFHFNRRDFAPARELAERVLAMAKQGQAPATVAGAHSLLGIVRFSTGNFPDACEHLREAVEFFSASSSPNTLYYLAQAAPVMLVAVLVILGYPTTALVKTKELLSTARRFSDPFSLANALGSDLLRRFLLRDTQMVPELAGEMLAISSEHGMVFGVMLAMFYRGWAMAAAGRAEEGIAEMSQSTSDPMFAETLATAMHLVGLAETYAKNGWMEQAFDLVTKNLAIAEQSGLRMTEAELCRVEGELMVQNPCPIAEAERCLRAAIDVARRQSARLFELRATARLARLLANRGHRDEARAMLTDIYNWFTEGIDTTDLKDAKMLLDELSV